MRGCLMVAFVTIAFIEPVAADLDWLSCFKYFLY